MDVVDISTTSRANSIGGGYQPNTPSPISTLSSTSASQGVHRDVSAELLERGHIKHRKHGDVPYPLKSINRHIADHETIDSLFVSHTAAGFTLTDFKRPPRRVLDLGCGTGFWIISAAQHWKETHFVGFDISHCQPNLHYTALEYRNRIEWVHGNFLDGLPFEDEEFDMVRIMFIGLGVPEDEWQFIFDEVVRVMTKDGVVEVIEEDLIFPCPESPMNVNRTPHASPSLLGRSSRSYSRSTIGNNSNSTGTNSNNSGFSNSGSHYSSTSHYSGSGSHSHSSEGDTFEDFYDELFESGSKSRSIDTLRQHDQRDHSKLKQAFYEMLSARFINPQVLTVLPFYLQTAFQEVEAIPHIRIFLPPPSGIESLKCEAASAEERAAANASNNGSEHGNMGMGGGLDLGLGLGFGLTSGSISSSSGRIIEMSNHIAKHVESNLGTLQDQTRSRFALRRILETVRGCKEEMWKEYEKINRSERKTANPRADREDFEIHFYNWECDMQDRINMQDTISSILGWEKPTASATPYWYEWRIKGDTEDVEAFFAHAPPEPIRTVRAFICRRPVQQVTSDSSS